MTLGAAVVGATSLKSALESDISPAARAAGSLEIGHCRSGAEFEGGQRQEHPHRRPGHRPSAGRAAHPCGFDLSDWTKNEYNRCSLWDGLEAPVHFGAWTKTVQGRG